MAEGGATTLDVWSVIGVAAAVGSTVAAIVSVALVLWFRYRDRPSADWFTERLTFVDSPRYGAMWAQITSGRPHEQIAITNVGDGTAYRVTAEGKGCKVMLYHVDPADHRGFSTPSAIARVVSADHLGVFIWHDDETKRDTERVSLSWFETPTRIRRKRTVDLDFPGEIKAAEDRYARDHKGSSTA